MLLIKNLEVIIMKYREALNEEVVVPKGSVAFTELVLTMINVMDNTHWLKLSSDNDKVKIRYYNAYCTFSLSNLQMAGDYRTDLEWAFLEGQIQKIIEIINTGTAKVIDYKYR